MLKIIWEWVKSACVIIVLFMILSGIKVVIKEWEKDENKVESIQSDKRL